MTTTVVCEGGNVNATLDSYIELVEVWGLESPVYHTSIQRLSREPRAEVTSQTPGIVRKVLAYA